MEGKKEMGWDEEEEEGGDEDGMIFGKTGIGRDGN